MRILVVDDNPDVASSLAELLKIDGCEDVVTAYDGAAALESVAASVPDLILCDLSLPGGIDGLDLARVCRKSPKAHHVRLVAISGYGDTEHRARAVEAGFDELLVKPVKFETLRDLVRRTRATHSASPLNLSE